MPKRRFADRIKSSKLKLPTEIVYREVTNKNGKKDRIKGYRLKLDVLTEDIINTGNLSILEDFYDQHEGELNDTERDYLESRIKGATKFENIKNEKLMEIADNTVPARPEPDVTEDGIEGFSNLKLDGPQTSNNGCWSCAYSLLLESRGVELSQEHVRSWRPDYDKNTAKEDKANPSRQFSLNTDTVNSVFENADLLSSVLPNTGMKQFTITPPNTAEMTIKGKPLNKAQAKIVEDYFIAQAKELLKDNITKAIKVNRSPVATVLNGHYVTITGIAPDGRLRIENSSKRLSNPTQYITLDDLIGNSFNVDRSNNSTRSVGVQLTYLEDLDTPAHEKKAEQKTELRKDEPDLVKTDASGNVKIDVPITHPTCSAEGKLRNGYVHGSYITSPLKLDQKELEVKLGGRIENFEPGEYHMGSVDEYYPQKVYFKGDPELKLKMEEYRRQNLLKNSLMFESAASDFLGSPEPGMEAVNGQMEQFRDAFINVSEAVSRSIVNRAGLDKNSIAGDIEKLKGLQAFFVTEQSNGKTGLEIVEGNIGSGDIDRMRNRMRDIGKAFPELGLDIDAAIAATEKSKQSRRDRGELVESYDATVRHQTKLDFSLLQASMATTPEERQRHLSIAVARYQMWHEGRMAGEGNPVIDDAELEARAEAFRNERAFKNIMADGNDVVIAKKKDIAGLIDELMTEDQSLKLKEQAIEAEKQKEIQKTQRRDSVFRNIAKKRGTRLLESATSLKRTLVGGGDSRDTGKYWGGIISRKKNSDAYEQMLTQLDKFETEPKSGTLKDTVDAVKTYLEGKEKVRKSGTGKERWYNCMQFLSRAMPRYEFETYCNKINAVRNVKPGDSDYVSSETFEADGTTVTSNIKAVMSRMGTGEVTRRDFARIIALHEMYDEPVGDNGEYADQDDFLDERINPKQLARKTEEVMKRDDFKKLMEKPGAELKDLVDKNGCMKLKDYKLLVPQQQKSMDMGRKI